MQICGNRAQVMNQQAQLRSGAQNDPRVIVSSSTQEKRKKEVEEEETTTTTTTTTRKKKTTTTTTTKIKTTEENGDQLVDDNKLAGHVRALISAKRAAPEFDSLLDNLNYKVSIYQGCNLFFKKSLDLVCTISVCIRKLRVRCISQYIAQHAYVYLPCTSMQS